MCALFAKKDTLGAFIQPSQHSAADMSNTIGWGIGIGWYWGVTENWYWYWVLLSPFCKIGIGIGYC